jgi:NAD(P)H-dependent FMN reductase
MPTIAGKENRNMTRIAIIIGSTRPGRKAEAVARWVYDLASQRDDATIRWGP